MKKLAIPMIVVIAGILLTGCAVKNEKTGFRGAGLTYQSDVKKLDNGEYYLEVETAPFAAKADGAAGFAKEKAAEFCKAQNTTMQEVKTELDTHLRFNGVARLTFRCI